jgi:hypothetical protein
MRTSNWQYYMLQKLWEPYFLDFCSRVNASQPDSKASGWQLHIGHRYFHGLTLQRQYSTPDPSEIFASKIV